jgi:hypothetical protein
MPLVDDLDALSEASISRFVAKGREEHLHLDLTLLSVPTSVVDGRLMASSTVQSARRAIAASAHRWSRRTAEPPGAVRDDLATSNHWPPRSAIFPE